MKKLIVQKEKLINNINKIKEKAKKTDCNVIAMIKGNGYGLGIVPLAELLVQNGISVLAVSLFEEAKQLLDADIKCDVMLLSPISDRKTADEAAMLDIIMTVSSEESAKIINAAAKKLTKPLRVQIAIDTGFGRFGFLYSDTAAAAAAVLNLENCTVYGCFSHLSDSFGKKTKNSELQFEKFKAALADLKARGIDTGICHIANSSAFMRFEKMHMDAVRIGSAFLGRIIVQNTIGLEKIAFLESEVIEIKNLPKGHNVGYANTCKAKTDIKIAVVPIGYMDGFGVTKAHDTYRFMDCVRYVYHNIMSIFNDMRVYVSVNGKKCPVLGRISMFNIVCDITGMDVKLNDKVCADCNPILTDSAIEREYR